MKRFTQLASLAVFTTVMITAAFAAGAAPAGDEPAAGQDRLVFDMVAQFVGTFNFGESVGGQIPMTITIERLNTPDERDALEEIIRADGMQALADALRSATRVGFIRAPRLASTGWQLRYAMIYAGPDNTRIIRIATDRPIEPQETEMRRRRSWDYNVTLIELVVDEDGNGSGVMYIGVEFAYDESNDTLGIKSLTSQPVRLENVRITEGG